MHHTATTLQAPPLVVIPVGLGPTPSVWNLRGTFHSVCLLVTVLLSRILVVILDRTYMEDRRENRRGPSARRKRTKKKTYTEKENPSDTSVEGSGFCEEHTYLHTRLSDHYLLSRSHNINVLRLRPRLRFFTPGKVYCRCSRLASFCVMRVATGGDQQIEACKKRAATSFLGME